MFIVYVSIVIVVDVMWWGVFDFILKLFMLD